MKDPDDMLKRGRRMLDPILEERGFRWVPGESGRSSGGHFARGEYVRGDRRLEVHVRHSLGLVRYHVGAMSVDHTSYMRVLLAPDGGNRYPGFSEDPLDGFRHLAHDLENFCDVFFSGTDEDFADIVRRVEADAKVTGVKRVP